MFDVWVLGDLFVKELAMTHAAINNKLSKKNKGDMIANRDAGVTSQLKPKFPYLSEYYNICNLYESQPGGVKLAMARIINTLIDTLDKKHCLPRFLIIVPDKDILNDCKVYSQDILRTVRTVVQWFVKQTTILLRHKREDILAKKPGALYSGDPTVIYVRMICRHDNCGKTTLQEILNLRSKFNEALNDAAAQEDQRILMINSCNGTEFFDQKGNLSTKGKHAVWAELNDLLERYDNNQVKLLLSPIVKQRVPSFQLEPS